MYKLENQIDNNISYYDDKGSNYSKMNYSFKQRYKDAYIKELDYMYKMILMLGNQILLLCFCITL